MKKPWSLQSACLVGLIVLFAQGCSVQSWQTVRREKFACHVEENLDHRIVSELASWTESDLAAVAGVIHLPIPERKVDVYCASEPGRR